MLICVCTLDSALQVRTYQPAYHMPVATLTYESMSWLAGLYHFLLKSSTKEEKNIERNIPGRLSNKELTCWVKPMSDSSHRHITNQLHSKNPQKSYVNTHPFLLGGLLWSGSNGVTPNSFRVDRMSKHGQSVPYQSMVTDVSLNDRFGFSITCSFPFLSFRTIIQLKPETLLFRNWEERGVFKEKFPKWQNLSYAFNRIFKFLLTATYVPQFQSFIDYHHIFPLWYTFYNPISLLPQAISILYIVLK